ncbi:MAG: hypothetical protein RBT87_04835 [bacterium]|nr:hypothetical protein [bacterium]
MINKENWKNKISLCFGIEDKKFASGGAQQKYAGEMIKEVIENEIQWNDYISALENYMESKGYSDEQKASAMKEIEKLFNYFAG